MRLILRALPAIGVLALTGSAIADITGPTPLAWRWAESAKISPTGTPQFNGENVIVAVGGRIYSLNKQSGNLNWRYPSGEAIAGTFDKGCILSGGVVLASADDKSVYAIDVNTGDLKWQHLASEPITSNLVVTGRNIAFISNKQTINVIDFATGGPVGTPSKEQTLIHDDIAAFGDQMIYTTQRGRMVSYDTSSNRPKWDQQLQGLKPSGNFSLFNDRIYVNSSTYLICLRASSGSAVWQENVGRDLLGKPAANENGIASLTSRGELYFFNTTGKLMFGKPTPVGVPVSSPTFLGNMVSVSTANGAINLIDPKSATIVWSYVIAPITTNSTGSSNAAAPAPGGAGEGGASLGGAPGAGQTNQPPARDYTIVAGEPAQSGNSLFVLTRDASLLMFDKELGVDLTPPTIDMLWPTPGNDIAGKAPLEMIFKIEDLGIGIDPDSVKVMINGKEYVHRLSNDGFLSILIVTRGANPQIANGRATVSITATDWLGNTKTRDFSMKIDNSLNAVGSPPKPGANPNNGGGVGGFGGGGGGRGDGR